MKRITKIIILATFVWGVIIGSKAMAVTAGISASATKVEPKDKVTVTVSFGEKVSAAQFTLKFDSSKFEYKSNSATGMLVSYNPSSGVFAYASMTPDLTKVTFTFRAKTEGKATFSINGVQVKTDPKLDMVNANVSKGSISVATEKKEEKPNTNTNTNTNTNKNTNTNTNTNKNTNTNTNKNTNTNTNTNKNTNTNTNTNKNTNTNTNKNTNTNTNKTTTEEEAGKEQEKVDTTEEQPQETEEQPTNEVVEEQPNQEPDIVEEIENGTNEIRGEETEKKEEKKQSNIGNYIFWILIVAGVTIAVVIIVRENRKTY